MSLAVTSSSAEPSNYFSIFGDFTPSHSLGFPLVQDLCQQTGASGRLKRRAGFLTLKMVLVITLTEKKFPVRERGEPTVSVNHLRPNSLIIPGRSNADITHGSRHLSVQPSSVFSHASDGHSVLSTKILKYPQGDDLWLCLTELSH
ncbi:hypothetical protein ACTXT7_005098 [Hymenolepis weldensis]